MIDTDDKLLRVFDQLVEAVHWSAESVTFAEALFEAIDDWIALVAAEFSESVAIEADSTGGGLGASLLGMAAAVDMLRVGGQPEMTFESALAVATMDWLQLNTTSAEPVSST
jgi:hypothetical protein